MKMYLLPLTGLRHGQEGQDGNDGWRKSRPKWGFKVNTCSLSLRLVTQIQLLIWKKGTSHQTCCIWSREIKEEPEGKKNGKKKKEKVEKLPMVGPIALVSSLSSVCVCHFKWLWCFWSRSCNQMFLHVGLDFKSDPAQAAGVSREFMCVYHKNQTPETCIYKCVWNETYRLMVT